MLEGGINHLLRPLLTGQSFPTLVVRDGAGVVGGDLVATTLAGPLCTSLDRVGSGEGPDLDRIATLAARRPGVRVWGAGGVRDAADLEALASTAFRLHELCICQYIISEEVLVPLIDDQSVRAFSFLLFSSALAGG